jgi:hypothetical protein
MTAIAERGTGGSLQIWPVHEIGCLIWQLDCLSIPALGDNHGYKEEAGS